jgi:methylmalonyl-CoA mutase N-terminal domain/subunit
MNEGIDQSMLPRLKSPPTNMFEEFVLSNLTKDKSHGGVLLAITKDFISSEITELKTNCEIVWAEINITGTSGFPVMNEGIDQSMLPRLKSPPTHMFEEFVLSNLRSQIKMNIRKKLGIKYVNLSKL